MCEREPPRFISHRVNIFQPSHEFKTANICFISLQHKCHKVIHNLFKLKNDLYFKNLSFFSTLCCGLKLLLIMIKSASPILHVCKHLLVFAFKLYYQTEMVMAKQVN